VNVALLPPAGAVFQVLPSATYEDLRYVYARAERVRDLHGRRQRIEDAISDGAGQGPESEGPDQSGASVGHDR